MTKQIRRFSNLAAALVLMIAAFAFILSYDAIRELAIDNGVKTEYAWMVPFIIDGSMVVFSVSVIRAALTNEKQWPGWVLIGLFTAVSIAFNVGHSNAEPYGITIAILTPLALLFTFETLMGQIKSTLQGELKTIEELQAEFQAAQASASDLQAQNKRLQDNNKTMQAEFQAAQARGNDLQAQNKRLQDAADKLQGQVEGLQETAVSWQTLNPVMQAAARYNAGQFETLQAAAETVQVDASTISRYAKQLNGVQK